MNPNAMQVYMLIADEDDRALTATIVQHMPQIALSFFINAGELFAAIEKKKPALILIDYNIAPEPGIEVLQQLKSERRTSAVPVCILTDSSEAHYHGECYQYGASTVIKKPGTEEQTVYKIKTFFDYWSGVAETMG